MQHRSRHNRIRAGSKLLAELLLAVLLLALPLGVGVQIGALFGMQSGASANEGVGGVAAIGQTVSEADFSELTYAALGDSITMGGIGGAVADEPYCVCVGNMLHLKSVTNYGVSGSTLCSDTPSYPHGYKPMCERYSEMGAADIVSVMGGTNDFTQGIIGTMDDTATDTVYGALHALAKGLKEKYPNAFLFFMTPLKSVWGTPSKQAQICQAFKDVGANYDIPVLDTYSLCDFSLEYGADGYRGDGVHPSQAFYRDVLAPVIADFIRENYEAQAPAKEQETPQRNRIRVAIVVPVAVAAVAGAGIAVAVQRRKKH